MQRTSSRNYFIEIQKCALESGIKKSWKTTHFSKTLIGRKWWKDNFFLQYIFELMKVMKTMRRKLF